MRFSQYMLSRIDRPFRLWYAFRNRLLDRVSIVKEALRIVTLLVYYPLRHQNSSDRDVAATAKSLIKHGKGLFTVLVNEAVESPNNSAEQGIRTAIQWRKTITVISPRGVNHSLLDC